MTKLMCVLALALSLTACSQNPIQPSTVGPPVVSDCQTNCRVVYYTVYDYTLQIPIKARVTIDGKEYRTKSEGFVAVLVNDTTVWNTVVVEAYGRVTQTFYPTEPLQNQYVLLREIQ